MTGDVQIEGGKTAAGFLIATALISHAKTVLHGIPDVHDVRAMLEIARANGMTVTGGSAVTFCASDPVRTGARISATQAAGARASIIATVALAIRRGTAWTYVPGGCDFAVRPIDIHLRVLSAAGARVRQDGRAIHIDASRLAPFRVCVDGPGGPSLGGTVSALLLAAAVDGSSEILGANRAPEADEVVALLRAWGVTVVGEGTDRIIVTGPVQPRDVQARVRPDRIEAGTFAIAGAVTAGRVRLIGVDWHANDNLWRHLNAVGVETVPFVGGVEARLGPDPVHESVTAGYFPLFPTDLHPQVVSLLALGTSRTSVRDLAFRGRVSHLVPLSDFGVRISPSRALCCAAAGYQVHPSRLRPARGRAPDIRTGAALVLAALAGPRRSTSVIDNMRQIERGYARFADKLAGLGADIDVIR